MLILIIVNVNAGFQKGSVCPALTEDSLQILSSIQSLRDTIKIQAECAPIEDKLKNVAEIMSYSKWGEVKKMFSTTEAPALEGSDIDEIDQLVTQAARNLTEVIGMINGNKANCLDESDRISFLAKLSGVVSEVSSIAGSVTGPYGMAVSLGGSIISAAITGIDKAYNNKAYHFKNPDDEILFMNQFCSFSEIQKDIYDYLELSTRQEELQILDSYLGYKIGDLLTNCPLCEGYEIAWQAKRKSRQIINNIKEDIHIVENGNNLNNGEYTRCKEMHRAFYTRGSDFFQFIELFRTYENPMSSKSDDDLINEIVAASDGLKDIYPNFSTCMLLDQDKKIKISHNFNSLMRDDILPLDQEIFTQQMNSFKNQANRKYVEQLGGYIELSLERRIWIKDEIAHVGQEIRDPNYDLAKEKIRQTKRDLENRFVLEILPQYLEFLADRNLDDIKDFKKSFQKFEKKMIKAYNKILNLDIDSLADLEVILNQKNQDKRIFLAEQNRVIEKLKLALDQTKTFGRYCDYIKYMMLGTVETEQICIENTDELKGKYSALVSYDQKLAELINKANLWERGAQIIQKSRVQEFSQHIENWNQRGDLRWRLR